MSDRPAEKQADCFNWRAHPARERGGRTALAVLLIGALAAVIGFQFGWLWAAGAAALLLLSLNRFFLASRFTIDEQGITARYPLRRQRLRWRDVRRFVSDQNGGYLSTRAQPSWIDAYRGMHLLFGAQREAVIQRIRGHIKAHECAPENRALAGVHS